jgi:hypothetical protein
VLQRNDARVDESFRHRGGRRRGGVARALTVAGVVLVFLALGAGLAAALTHFVDPGMWLPADAVRLPARTPEIGAAVVTTCLCGLLAHRVGWHTPAAVLFSALAAGAAVAMGWTWLLAGVAALTAFAATVLAVVATRPARRPLHVVREYVAAIVVALTGAVAVAAYAAPLKPTMLGHVVLLASLVATLRVAHRLGGGFPGLGKRGAVVIVSAVAVLVAGLAYSEALERWASPGVSEALAGVQDAVVGLMGAAPRPLELFIGFPALVWGLATRAQLRQGWWVCAFGVLATSGVATSLAAPGAELGPELLATLYSVLVGLVLGFVVWRADRLFTGPRGRRARGAERALPLRPEPPRSQPLL